MQSLVKFALSASLLCVAGGGQVLAERPADDRTSALLTAAQGQALVDLALRNQRQFHPKPDCSHLVHRIYALAGLNYEYAGSRDIYYGAEGFDRVFVPQPGDLIVWVGHVGIVVAPEEQTFFSSVRSGITTESWTADYWYERGRPRFYRYRISPATDPVLLAALTPQQPAPFEDDDESEVRVSPGSGAVRSGPRPDPSLAKTTATSSKAARLPMSGASQPRTAARQSSSAATRPPIATSSRPLATTSSGPADSTQSATPSEPPAVVALLHQRAKPSKRDVAAALAQSGTARAQKLAAGQTLDLARPVSVVVRAEVEKIKIKNDVGSVRLKLTEAIALESGRVITDKTVVRQLGLYRRGEVWVICDSQERFYLPQEQALNAFERQAEIFLRQAPSGSGTRSIIKALDILYDREAALRQRAALK